MAITLPDERQGVASAINDTTREVGSALGVALLGGVLASRYSDAMRPLLSDFPDRTANAAGDGIARALTIASQVPEEHSVRLIEAAQRAFVEGWARSMWMGADAMCVLFVAVLFAGRQEPNVHFSFEALEADS